MIKALHQWKERFRFEEVPDRRRNSDLMFAISFSTNPKFSVQSWCKALELHWPDTQSIYGKTLARQPKTEPMVGRYTASLVETALHFLLRVWYETRVLTNRSKTEIQNGCSSRLPLVNMAQKRSIFEVQSSNDLLHSTERCLSNKAIHIKNTL